MPLVARNRGSSDARFPDSEKSPGVLEFRELEKSYGSTHALDSMSFVVPPGEVFGFLGPNGAGKTTAMRAIFSLVELESGSVVYNGNTLVRGDLAHFGYMPEERGLYPKMTVLEHLIYLGRLHEISKSQALGRARELIERLEIVGGGSAKIEALSLGNRQRTQIAAALIHQPDVLVLDEPFSGLDPLSVEVVREILSDYASRGRTVLFSSHQLELVEDFCQSVAIANHGHIVLSGSVAEITSTATILTVAVREDPRGDYLSSLAGLRRLDNGSAGQRVQVADDAQAQLVLQAAIGAGHVERFTFERRRLSEVFIEAVQGDNARSKVAGVAPHHEGRLGAVGTEGGE